MTGSVSYLVAFGGGVVSFASPCVLPVVPAYLSMVTGFDLTESAQANGRRIAHIVRDGALFIAGFGCVFVALGVSATALGSAVHRAHLPLTRISGAVVIVMSLFLCLSLFAKLPFFYREARFHPRASRLGVFAAPIIGIAFGLGWTPCITPVLSSVLAVAASQHETTRGALLLAAYSVGLGVPFVALGCGFGRLAGALRVVRRHSQAIMFVSAAVLFCLGLLLVVDRLSWVTTEFAAMH